MSTTLLNEYTSPLAGTFKNRVVMSAMTRGFADKDHCATDLMRAYYERRAQDGVALILTEGMVIHPSADGYNNVPQICTEAQAESWKPITSALHAAGSKIYSQLWHCGRISHEDYTGGVAPVSASTVQAEGMNRQNNKPYGVPHALTPEEIKEWADKNIQSTSKNKISDTVLELRRKNIVNIVTGDKVNIGDDDLPFIEKLKNSVSSNIFGTREPEIQIIFTKDGSPTTDDMKVTFIKHKK